jgi:predicted HNH restriction endonuclease
MGFGVIRRTPRGIAFSGVAWYQDKWKSILSSALYTVYTIITNTGTKRFEEVYTQSEDDVEGSGVLTRHKVYDRDYTLV